MELPPAGIIGGIISFAVMSFVIWAANRRKQGAPPLTSAFYGAGMVAVAIGTVLIYSGIIAALVLSVLAGNPTATIWIFLLFGGFGLLLAFMVFDVFTRRIEWNDQSLRFRSWRGEAMRNWDDIVAMELKPLLQYVRIGFRDGSGFAILEYLTGARALTAEIRRRGVDLTLWGKPIEDAPR